MKAPGSSPGAASSSTPAADEPLPAEPGEVIGSYRLLAVLSRGGMGCVYRAEHVRIGRAAAVKVLAPRLTQDPSFVRRFVDEARISSALRHPHVIDIYDLVEASEPPRVACVMELLAGETLKVALERGRLSMPRALAVAAQLGDALSAVHAAGIVHRDLKPSNVMLLEVPAGAAPQVKLLDFGIAKLALDDPRTAPGTMLGTPGYMAPEQVRAAAVSPATDVYALGELLYEMLSGRRLFTGPARQVLRLKLAGGQPRLELPPGLSAAEPIRALIEGCLAAEPERRPPLAEVREKLAALLAAGLTDAGLEIIAAPTLPLPGTRPPPHPPDPLARPGLAPAESGGPPSTVTPVLSPPGAGTTTAPVLPREQRGSAWVWAAAVGMLVGAGITVLATWTGKGSRATLRASPGAELEAAGGPAEARPPPLAPLFGSNTAGQAARDRTPGVTLGATVTSPVRVASPRLPSLARFPESAERPANAAALPGQQASPDRVPDPTRPAGAAAREARPRLRPQAPAETPPESGPVPEGVLPSWEGE